MEFNEEENAGIIVAEKKNPRLSIIYVYLMNSCNLNCIHCWVNPSFTREKEKKNHLSITKFKKIFDQAVKLGLKKVKLTGGEPLIYPHFVELVEYLKEQKINITMETNGTLITEKIADAIRDSSFYHVAVSLDGAGPKTHERVRRVKGAFNKTLEGVKRLTSRKIPTQIIMCVYKDNMQDIEAVAKLAQDIGANTLKLNYINILGRGRFMKEEGELLSVKEIIELDRHIMEKVSEKYKIGFYSNTPMAFESLRDLRRRHGTCHIQNILGILADGKVSICGIGEEVKELVLGDATKTLLTEIWSQNSILHYIRENIPNQLEGVCSRCIFKRKCLGCCIAETYTRTGDFKSPFYFCQKAYEEGVFPQSRLV